MIRLFIGFLLTVGTFFGGLVAGEPLGMVLFVTLFMAWFTGFAHWVWSWIVEREQRF